MKRMQFRWASLLVVVAMLAGIFAPIARAEDASAVHGINQNDMNLGVEPGTDFYDFSNGGWLAETELPATNPSYGVFNELDDQVTELTSIAATGVDGLVLVTNRFDPKGQGGTVFMDNLRHLLDALPADLPLGLYECPAPFRRLMSDDELAFCAESGRFAILKDVSCDLETVKRRVALTKNSSLAIVNANAAIAFDAIRSGSAGFTGVFTNFHPDLYKWLLTDSARHPALADDLSVYLALAAMAEPMGYPKLAKLYHQRLGTFACAHSRTIDFDIRERFWALDALLDKIMQGQASFRARIAATR